MHFRTLRQLAEQAEAAGLSIGRYMLQEQAGESGKTPAEEFQQMATYYGIMKDAVRRGLTEDTTSRSGLTGQDAKRILAYRGGAATPSVEVPPIAGAAPGADASPGAKATLGAGSPPHAEAPLGAEVPPGGHTLLGDEASLAMSYALAVSEVNASMGRIIATPTAGSCGIIPGVFVSCQERFGWSDEDMTHGLFAAGAIGYVIANNSFVSGAEGGCQAEVGSAIGMAAGALADMRGAKPTQAIHAVGLALKNSLGLVCDPVGGLVEVPCIVRNGFGAVTALAAADMALAGVRSVIPSDEVVQVMLEVGTAMPDTLRETARGGLAQTPTGQQIMKDLRKKK
ncbi:L-serine ammonia-lyase, iron-sulfur-dependent, subunit alpha [Paenibacillus sacheonensis]|uniref:L-serine dehydratase n=1 Tax=Paenibacillus sacheonensis TaxID=742054 RepID=A0A7X5C1A0_9BACL|nr:L-serine ammonia-lyase, iron-sulfur-dependent, subunit alpha [Paenibacillus sacheonensis]MBM7568854.1 L-serine dehydratase [Paenibacillus sacheonensis]NBC72557.1 L-serine ammonia-lyase, iron-sulfur-dependent, subunit alpha [Paenibacillus sacheonensis]